MIECSNLRLAKGQCKLVNGVSWSFASGQITAIVGPNGAGKSTLLKLLLGLEEPDSGKIMLNKRPLEEWDIKYLASVRAYMSQHHIARLSLPVFEYLALARVHRVESLHTRDKFVSQIIDRLDLSNLATKLIDTLSGGEFQRVELARAWCQLITKEGVRDTVLILDEPSAALDIRHTQRLYENLSLFTEEGGTVIVVEHDINLAARFCSTIMMIKEGRCIAGGKVSETFTQDNINTCFDVAGRTIADPHSNLISFSL